jgi:hypothetical protein
VPTALAVVLVPVVEVGDDCDDEGHEDKEGDDRPEGNRQWRGSVVHRRNDRAARSALLRATGKPCSHPVGLDPGGMVEENVDRALKRAGTLEA